MCRAVLVVLLPVLFVVVAVAIAFDQGLTAFARWPYRDVAVARGCFATRRHAKSSTVRACSVTVLFWVLLSAQVDPAM